MLFRLLLLVCMVEPLWHSTAHAADAHVQVLEASGKPLAGAVVFLESRETKQLAKPLRGAEIAQVNKQFSPNVLVVTTGTAVAFPNRDTVRHHVYSFSPIKPFELKLYTGTDASPVNFDRPGIAVLGCNIHDAMAAWVVVVDTPFFGRTTINGASTIVNVPPGSYRLKTWHPSMPIGAIPSEQDWVMGHADSSVTVQLIGVRG